MEGLRVNDGVGFVERLDEGGVKKLAVSDGKEMEKVVDVVGEGRMEVGGEVFVGEVRGEDVEGRMEDGMGELRIRGVIEEGERVLSKEGMEGGRDFGFVEFLED